MLQLICLQGLHLQHKYNSSFIPAAHKPVTQGGGARLHFFLFLWNPPPWLWCTCSATFTPACFFSDIEPKPK